MIFFPCQVVMRIFLKTKKQEISFILSKDFGNWHFAEKFMQAINHIYKWPIVCRFVLYIGTGLFYNEKQNIKPATNNSNFLSMQVYSWWWNLSIQPFCVKYPNVLDFTKCCSCGPFGSEGLICTWKRSNLLECIEKCFKARKPITYVGYNPFILLFTIIC